MRQQFRPGEGKGREGKGGKGRDANLSIYLMQVPKDLAIGH